MEFLPKTLEELRLDVINAKLTLDTHPTYGNSVLVQNAQRDFDAAVAENRAGFHVIDGSSGLHSELPYDIMKHALKEICFQADLHEKVSGRLDNMASYMFKVAKNALKDSGNG